MIVIIDYGLGNLKSVAAAVKRLGYEFSISNRAEDFQKADKLILPGVGAFGDGMRNLLNLNLIAPLTRIVLEQGKPILGICLGAQLMAKESVEFGHHQGLGWIDASVIKLETGDQRLRLPHVGWNNLLQVRRNILFEGIPNEALFYYVHSFYVQCRDFNIVIAECEYGEKFTAAFNRGNIYATQFHPEKSQLYGLRLLDRKSVV